MMYSTKQCLYSSGKLLRSIRTSKNVTIVELSKVTGFCEQYIARMELGFASKNRYLILNNIHFLLKACKYLEVDPVIILNAITEDLTMLGKLEIKNINISQRKPFPSNIICNYKYAERIRYARNNLGLSVNDISNLTGYSLVYLMKMELGFYGIPSSIRYIITMCIVLGIPYSEMIQLISEDIENSPAMRKINSSYTRVCTPKNMTYSGNAIHEKYQSWNSSTPKKYTSYIYTKVIKEVPTLLKISKELNIPTLKLYNLILKDLQVPDNQVNDVKISDISFTNDIGCSYSKIIYSARIAMGLSLAEAAELCGVSERSYWSYEHARHNGKIFIIKRISTLIKICSTLKIPYEQLFLAITEDMEQNTI